MKDKTALTSFIVCGVFVLVFLFILPISSLMGFDIKSLMTRYPALSFAVPGGLMILFSVLLLIFRTEAGNYSANYRKKLAEKHPGWKKMAGLPEEKLEYYFSLEFNRKMIVVAAYINLVVGLILIIVGLMILK